MKKNNWRSILKKLFIWSNILLVLFTIPVSLVPFLNPSVFWYIAVLGIAFPFLLLCNILFLVSWAFLKSRWCFLSIITIILSGQQVIALFGFHFFNSDKLEIKTEHSFRVLCWNVSRWDEANKKIKGGSSYRPLMMDEIKIANPDVLCLQEFFEPRTNRYFSKNIAELTNMGYPYHCFFPMSSINGGEFSFGMAIFSKNPIKDSGYISFGKTPHSEGLIFADVEIRNKKIRFLSTHLESFRAGKRGYLGEEVKSSNYDRLSFVNHSLRNAYNYRASQVKIVRHELDNSPYPVVLCGDLGDVPNSYTYFTLRKDMQDVFLKRGKGSGATFNFFWPGLRLDYLMISNQLKAESLVIPKLNYSDHYPLIADISYRN